VRLGAATREGFEGVTMKYRLTPQPQDNGTTPRLIGISVALRISPSVLVPDLTGIEKGAYCSPLEHGKYRVAFPALCPTSFTLRLPGTLQLVRPPDFMSMTWWD